MKKVEYKSILIVEDSDGWRTELCDYFSQANAVHAARTLAEAIKEINAHEFDAVLLDLILPDGSGLTLLEKIGRDVPVIIFSDLGSDEDILQGLEFGAADYIVKPASVQVVEARVSLRLLPPKEAILSLHGLTLDIAKRTVVYRGQPIGLTSNEFNILMFLMQNAGVVFSTNEIYEKVWKMPHLNTQTVRIHLHNLRKKMMYASDDCGALILTEFGKGYAFCGGKDE